MMQLTVLAIFEAVIKLIMANKGADVITVYGALQADGKDADLSYLNAIQQNTPGSANIARYAEIVRDKAVKRGMVSLCRETEQLVVSSPDTSEIILDGLTTRLNDIAKSTIQSYPELMRDGMVRHIESIDARYNGALPDAIPTGFIDLDKKLNGGMRRGNLIVVAGRPKMGKTGFALNIACSVAMGGVALVLSMEMGKSEVYDRNLASLGKISLDHLIDPKQLTPDDWPNLTHAISKVNSMLLYVEDKPALTLMNVRNKAKAVKRKSGLDLLVIDYLQLMSGDGDNRNAQIEAITRGLKGLAKELDCVIILLSQLNRKLEERPNKRPQPADLRDSGSIEQDCDIAMFLYRDEVYNPDSMDKGVCEVNIALNRQGAQSVVALTYIGEQTRFADMGRSWHPAPPKKPATRSRGFDD
jgi:replicative DNA helicase